MLQFFFEQLTIRYARSSYFLIFINTGTPRYPHVCYLRFWLFADCELRTKIVIGGFPRLSADLALFEGKKYPNSDHSLSAVLSFAGFSWTYPPWITRETCIRFSDFEISKAPVTSFLTLIVMSLKTQILLFNIRFHNS